MNGELRRIPDSLMASPTSSSLPWYISEQSRWMKPFQRACLISSTILRLNESRSWGSPSLGQCKAPVPKATCTFSAIDPSWVGVELSVRLAFGSHRSAKGSGSALCSGCGCLRASRSWALRILGFVVGRRSNVRWEGKARNWRPSWFGHWKGSRRQAPMPAAGGCLIVSTRWSDKLSRSNLWLPNLYTSWWATENAPSRAASSHQCS